MNVFDIIVAAILAYSLIRGLFRGLVKEVASIIGVLGGFLGAYSYFGIVSEYLSGIISNPAYRNILAFMLIFCAVLILINVLAVIIKYVLKVVLLGWLDRLGGVGFGIVKGALIVSVLFLMLTAFLPKGTPLVRDSLFAPYISVASEKLAALVSSEIRNEFDAKLETLKKSWNIFK